MAANVRRRVDLPVHAVLTVLGVPELRVGHDEAVLTSPGDGSQQVIGVGDILSIHGQTGEVFAGSRDLLGIDKVRGE